MISATMVDTDTYEVVVSGDPETTHRVTMSNDYYRSLCGGTVTQEWVLIQSFTFLLEREPSTAILKSFELSTIGQYFPEFEGDIKKRLA